MNVFKKYEFEILIIIALLISFLLGFCVGGIVQINWSKLDGISNESELNINWHSNTLYNDFVLLRNEINNARFIYKMTATAYAPYDNQSGVCNDGNPNSTSTGTKPADGTIVVNPKKIAYHSELIIIGDGGSIKGQALDTGGAMRQNPYQIDIFHWTYKEAMEFGRQEVIVIVKGE